MEDLYDKKGEQMSTKRGLEPTEQDTQKSQSHNLLNKSVLIYTMLSICIVGTLGVQ